MDQIKDVLPNNEWFNNKNLKLKDLIFFYFKFKSFNC